MTSLLASEDVIDVENIITILIVISIIFNAFARLGQDAAWIPRRLVVEARIANAIGCRKMGCQSLKWLWKCMSIGTRDTDYEGVLTLMKPPSGFARR